jgi:hypothetical protein
VYAGKAHAYGTVAMATASGAITITINGVAVGSETWATSDAATGTALCVDIVGSSDALVQNIVYACNLAATFTLASVAAGQYVEVLGYRFTAASPSSGLREDEFSISGTDAQDATALANAINARPGCNELVIATVSSAVVTVRQITGTSAAGVLAKSGAGITLSGQLAATGTVLITSQRPGVFGNCITLAATGTNTTASGARLTGGTEDTFTF